MGGFSGNVQNEIVLASSVAVTNPLDANENILATINIPPLGASSSIIVDYLETKTGIQSNLVRVRLGGIAGTKYREHVQTTGLSINDTLIISNRNNTSLQVGGSESVAFGQTTTAIVTGAIDTSVATTLVITAQQSPASVIASEVVKLERYRVKITY
jgi:hypothetical protein